jgi:hypothetical protein
MDFLAIAMQLARAQIGVERPETYAVIVRS